MRKNLLLIALLSFLYKNYQATDNNVMPRGDSLSKVSISQPVNKIINGNFKDIENFVKNLTIEIEKPLKGTLKNVMSASGGKKFSFNKTIKSATRMFTGSSSSSDILRDERLYFPTRRSTTFSFFGGGKGGGFNYF